MKTRYAGPELDALFGIVTNVLVPAFFVALTAATAGVALGFLARARARLADPLDRTNASPAPSGNELRE